MLLTVLLVSLLCSISGGFNTFREESLLPENSSEEPGQRHLPAHQFSALLYSLQQDTEAAQPAEGLHLLPWSVFQINIFQQIILLIFVSVSVGAITNIAVCYVMSPSSSLIEFGQKKKTKLVSSFLQTCSLWRWCQRLRLKVVNYHSCGEVRESKPNHMPRHSFSCPRSPEGCQVCTSFLIQTLLIILREAIHQSCIIDQW